jgi:hypothetical protein
MTAAVVRAALVLFSLLVATPAPGAEPESIDWPVASLPELTTAWQELDVGFMGFAWGDQLTDVRAFFGDVDSAIIDPDRAPLHSSEVEVLRDEVDYLGWKVERALVFTAHGLVRVHLLFVQPGAWIAVADTLSANLGSPTDSATIDDPGAPRTLGWRAGQVRLLRRPSDHGPAVSLQVDAPEPLPEIAPRPAVVAPAGPPTAPGRKLRDGGAALIIAGAAHGVAGILVGTLGLAAPPPPGTNGEGPGTRALAITLTMNGASLLAAGLTLLDIGAAVGRTLGARRQPALGFSIQPFATPAGRSVRFSLRGTW